MVTSGKRFIINQDKKNSAVTQLTDNVAKPISIPSSLQQEKEIPAGVQKIIQNQPGTPNGSISAPDKSNTQLRLEYQKQQMADKARDIKESVVSNAKSLGDSFVSELSKAEEKTGSEVAAAAATKFTMNAAEVEEAARREAGLLKVENRQAQEGKPRVESEFGRMVGDTSKLQEPFKIKLGFSPSPFKTGYLNFLGDEVSLTNGTSSITKPVIKTIDYESVLGQAYDTITYKAANEQEIMTVESFDELFPEYKDVPYDQKQIFINECLYDVQQGKKRDINEFADFFGSMSMKEGYVNQQDATIQYLTDSDVAKYSLNAFLGGSETLEGRTPEQIRDYIEAAYTIKAYADEINKQGYNVTDSAGRTIVKSFADDFEDLNQAIKTFENFNLTNTEAFQINNLYEKNLRTQNELINDFVYGNEIEQHNALKQFEDQYLYQFHKDYINSFIREVTWDYQKDMEGPIKSSDWNEFLMWLYQDYYEIDGRRFNKDGEEILHSEGRDGFLNKVADGFIGLASEVETLGFDTAIAQKAWKESDDLNYQRERTMDVLFDTVNVAFSGMMEFTGGGQLFQFATTLGRAGAQLDWLFSKTMEGLGFVAEGMANMIGFTDGWSPESKEKYKQAMEGIGIMLLGRLKNSIVKRGKAEMLKYLDETAMMKALKAYVAQTAEGLEVRDGGKVKEVIKNKGKTEEKKGEPKTRKEIEQKAKTEKKTEEKISEEENQKGAITLKQGTQENALKSFREIFDEEIKKINAEGKSQKIVDTLFQAASSLADKIFSEKTGEKEAPKETVKAPEIASDSPIEGKTETITTEAPESKTQQTETPTEQTDIETTPEAPGVVVEEATTKTPETPEGVAETREPESVKEAKTTIAKILDVIQSIQDNAKEIVNNIFKPDIEKQTRKEIEEREARDELFRREGLTEKQIEVVENNPFTDSVIRIVNRLVSEITDKKGNVKDTRLEDKMSNDEIQREVLSDGLTRMQKYVDRIQQLKKAIGKLYDALSTQKNIRSRQFLYSEPFQRLLRENGLEYIERLDDKGNPKRAVVANDGRVLSANERAVAKYIESMIDIITEKAWISEKDAHNIRTNFTSKGDWDSSGNFPKAVKKALYERWNEFLEQQGSSEMLRKIDQGYAELSENLEVLSDLLGKDSTIKDNAKNQILKRDEKTLDQMESILPGIKKLVELTKQSPDIVNKTIKAKTQYKQTRVWLGNWIRYAGVMLASTVGGRGGFILGSLGFTTLERLGNALKSKAVKTKLDRNLYNQYVEALKVDGNTKASFKKGEIERYNELSKIAEGKTQAEIDKLLDDATQILIDRQAAKIREQKQAEWERYLRSQGVGDTTPRLPESTQGGVVATDTFTLPQDRGVKETYKDKEKTQQGYSNAEQQIIDASLGKTEETTYSPEAEKVADILEKSLNETADIIEEDATNKVIEKGEELTDENIAKEIQKEPSSIEEFIKEVEKGAPEETKNYDGADIKDLEEVVANPKKYPNVDIEAAKSALEKARRQNAQAEIMQSPDQQQAQKEIAGIYKGNQMEREGNKGREKQREDMVRETNRDFDTLETTEEYDRIESQITPEKGEQAKKYAKGYKGFYRSDKAKTDTLRADMGKKPSQNITYTSSVDKIATLENPKSRARVAQERLNKRKRLSEEERTQLNQIIEQANVEIQAKEELKVQKTELANEYKRLDKKRSETPYRENKREYTKQMDKISDEFDKLTYEEQGQFAKPKEVEAEEIKEAERIEEERQNLDMNETPQKTEPEIKEQETKKESEGERSFGDEEYTNRDNKIEEMSKDESITIKDTISEVDEIVGGGIKDYQEKIYGEKRDKEESYTNDGAESFRNRVNDKIGERDRKFWEDQRSKTKDMESSKLTKEQEKQLEEAKTKEEKEALMNKWRKEYIERNPIAEKYLKEAEEHNKQFEKAMNALGKLDAIIRRIRRKRREDIDKRWEEAKRKLREEKKKEIDLLDQNETPQIAEPEIEKDVTIDDIEYNKSTNPDTVELEVYKGVRGYGIEDTPGDPNTTFYTNDKSRADQYSKKPDAEKQTISLDKSKVKIIDSRGIKRNQKVDENGNNIEGQTSKKGSDNYIDYNNRKATEEGYDAVIYRGITDIGPYVHKGTKIAESADDIVLLKKESPKTEETKKPEPNKPTGGTPLVDVAKDGTVNKEPGLGDYTTDQIQKRIDELKKKRQDNGKKLYAQDLSELRVLQDLLKRQIERENREEGSTELTDRQREILNSNNYGDQYRAGGAGASED